MAEAMGEFVITTPGGEEFTITARDEGQATQIFNNYQNNNYTGPEDKNGVPEGMVFDPATNRMVDAKALANQINPEGSLPGAAIKGMPFAGEYADELVGYLASNSDTKNDPNASQPIQTEVARQLQKTYEDKSPKTAFAAKLATGLTAIPAAIAMSPAMPASIAGKMALGGTLGGTLGATEGFISGLGEGTDGNRLDTAKTRAAVSGLTGAVLGGTMPLVADAAASGIKKIVDKVTVDRALNKLGTTRPAADAIKSAMQGDDALGTVAKQRLMKAGDDAMLADAGDTASNLLDTTIQKSGEAGRIARLAVEKRAEKAGARLKGTMDLVLGRPEGLDKAAKEIAVKSATMRKMAYDAAYAKPIDYASSEGRQIENIFSRTPPSILRAAIQEANDSMLASGMKNMQIMANIADDGSVSFREMPNVLQVDELKKALGFVAEANVDQFGRKTAAGLRAGKLAKELRDAAVKAVPEYERAIKLGGDKIAEDNALRIGNDLLRSNVTREEVSDAVKGITEAERKQLALGLRQHIDDKMANVTQALSDQNMDAREAAQILKDMSSRAAREKMVIALGERRANALAAEIDRAQAAINLKSAVATNSKTFARQEVAKQVESRGRDGILGALKEGRPLEAPRRAWQNVTGATADAQEQQSAEIYAQMAKILTGPRGPDAVDALEKLLAAYKTGTLNSTLSRQASNLLTGSLSLPVYQATPQLIPSRQAK